MAAKLRAAIGVAAASGAAALVWRWVTRPTLIRVAADLPDGFPRAGFSHAAFERLLERFVERGGVDYAAWHADRFAREELDRYLAAVARYSPENAPERFASEDERLSYWLYAYNAFVIKAVLERWPLASVTEVRAPIELVRGLGFFYALEFIAGGERYNLHRLEHRRVLRPGRDPRVHFVLNCGSGGCPLHRVGLGAAELDGVLERATREFIAEPKNASVDHRRREIVLSQIFEWYARDFIAELRRRGQPSTRGVVDYVAGYANEELAGDLAAARHYRVVFRSYDWSINAATKRAPE